MTRVKADPNIDQHAATQLELSNDVLREVQIYNNTLANTVRAIKELEKTNEKIYRPEDFYAEMFKDDEHMQKIRSRLEKKKQEVVDSEQNRKNKQQKKYQKQVKHRKNIDAAKEKNKNLNAIENWKQSIKRKENLGLDHFVNQKPAGNEHGGRKLSGVGQPRGGKGGKKFKAKKNRSTNAIFI